MRSERSTAIILILSAMAAGCGAKDNCLEINGSTCVWAGTGELGTNGDGKHRLETRFYWPFDLEFSPEGVPYFLDWNNHQIRRITAQDRVETVVGVFLGDGAPEDADLEAPGAPGLEVSLNHPTDMQFDKDGNLLFAAWHNHKIRHLDLATGLVHVKLGSTPGFDADVGTTATVKFSQPKAILYDPEWNLYILDQRNQRVRKVATDGSVTTVAGNGTPGFAGDGELAATAQLMFETGGNPEPSGGLALDADGNLYIADSLNHRIRRVEAGTGRIITIAGTGEAGYGGDGGAATSAQLNNPRDLELGPDGRLYIADTENHRIRALDLRTGTIELVAGSGEKGTRGDVVDPTQADLNRPFGIAFDAQGNLFIADSFNSRILKVVRR
jgi:DNA-binding beta-propeller fold protein YncE